MPTYVIALITIAAFVALLPFVLLAPRIAGRAKKAPFFNRNFAHRGLYDNDNGIPENSLAAFEKAAENGYGIELDVQLSRDGRVVVFHDDTLSRVCCVDKRVDELDFDELSKLSLCGTGERIPLFEEVLRTVNGRAPIIVELKNGRRNAELCEKTLACLRGYKGDVCIESFNPLIVGWFRFHGREFFRGQLSQPKEFYTKEGFSKTTGFVLGNLLMNAIARPNFIAYRIGKKPLALRFSKALGAVVIGWTAHDTECEKDYDSVIFEHCIPTPEYTKKH
ncbi:MAG: glycerophosphodiester phosphodiesterase [Clostridia bacterium]|nr:glycerophosphodiester phosphodiesterase [Clostridia bacterium]